MIQIRGMQFNSESEFSNLFQNFCKTRARFIATFNVLVANQDSRAVVKRTKRQKQRKYRATKNREPREKH